MRHREIMDRKTFVDILYSKSMTFSSKEIKEMLDEELAKPPEEMDTDLVDLCLDALDGKFDNIPNSTADKISADNDCDAKSKNKKRVKIGRILLIAAIVALILGLSVTVGAKFLSIDASEDVVQYSDDGFNVNLKNNTSDDIISVLENDGLNNIVLPAEITDGTYEISNYKLNTTDEETAKYTFDINSDKFGSGNVSIRIYNDNFDFSIGERKANSDFQNVTQIDKDNYIVLVFGDDEDSYLYYLINNVEYEIVIKSDFSTAYEMAKGM